MKSKQTTTAAKIEGRTTQQKPGFWQVFRSVGASMFGVQSEKNRIQDFQQTSFMPFILVGILFVVGLVLSLVLIVNLITS